MVGKRIVGDGDPLPAGAIIFRATIPAAQMPKDLQKPYPTFWGGPDWHMIYYPISDWTTFNLGCPALNRPDQLSEPQEFAPHIPLPSFPPPTQFPPLLLSLPHTSPP